jgi:hypothetical protein
MPIGAAPTNQSATSEVPSQWFSKPAGTYDLVTLCPGSARRCARKIVAMAADTWTFEDSDGNSNTVAVPAGFVHIGLTRGITCAAAIVVYY